MNRLLPHRLHFSIFPALVRRASVCVLPMVVSLLVGQNTVAQTNQRSAPLSNRWLFIVDTSRAMANRSEPARRAVVSLLESGVQGQMHNGDTVGLWTFNRQLQAGGFPLQVWTRTSRVAVARRVYTFLSAQKNEHQASLDPVIPAMKQVIEDSDYLTIILISSGDENIQGTPFDRQINSTYRNWKAAQQKAQMPFVTLLRAEHGRLTDYRVDMPPWPLKVPPLPAALRHTNRTTGNTIHQPEKKATATVPPLIVHGNQEPSPTVAKPSSATNPAPESSPAEVATGQHTPPTTPKLAPVRSNLTTPSAESLPKTSSLAAESIPAPAKPLSTAKPPTTPSKTESQSDTSKVGNPAIAAPIKQAPAAPATESPASAHTHQVNAPAPAIARSESHQNARPRSASSPAKTVVQPETAVAVPTQESANQGDDWILVLGILALVLASVALVIVILIMRRLRTHAGASLITRSLDREQK